MRPSLAFADTRPRNPWKLPLALVGFLAAAGGLLWMAIALRPTVAAAPAVSSPAAVPPGPVVHEVLYETAVGAPAPAPAVPPSPAPPGAAPQPEEPRVLVSFANLRLNGPHDRAQIERVLRQALPAVDSAFGGPRAFTAHCKARFDDDGRILRGTIEGDSPCHTLFQPMGLSRARRETEVELDLHFEAR